MASEIQKRAMLLLVALDAASDIEDLRFPPSNHLEQLIGKRRGQMSVRINQKWCICFIFKNGNAYAIEIVDYH